MVTPEPYECRCKDPECGDCFPFGRELDLRRLDQEVIRVWKLKQIPGDPPPAVQRAFDREGARLLRRDANVCL